MPHFEFDPDGERVVFDSGDGLEMLIEESNMYLSHFRPKQLEPLDRIAILDPRDSDYWVHFRGLTVPRDWLILERAARTAGTVVEQNNPPDEFIEQFLAKAKRN